MTYRHDSDFYHPYGHVIQVEDHPTDSKALKQLIRAFGQKNQNLSGNKKKAVAWFVSNCDSKSGRESYVEELKKHIQVLNGCLIH